MQLDGDNLGRFVYYSYITPTPYSYTGFFAVFWRATQGYV